MTTSTKMTTNGLALAAAIVGEFGAAYSCRNTQFAGFTGAVSN
jgi:hypothetical protein